MEYIYASMLLHKAHKEINEANVKKVLEAAGVKVDESRVKALIAALDGVNIEQAIEKASQAQVVAAPVASAPATGAAKAEEKKEEKSAEEEKKSEEAAAAGLGSLFG